MPRGIKGEKRPADVIGNAVHVTLMSRHLVRLSLALCFIGVFVPQSAVAQCPPGTPIYIDPRLAPQRPQVSREQFEAITANPSGSDEEKKRISDYYYNQNQPIQLPFRDGIVLINLRNPCIQQYLGK
jgi:hypothetical protein